MSGYSFFEMEDILRPNNGISEGSTDVVYTGSNYLLDGALGTTLIENIPDVDPKVLPVVPWQAYVSNGAAENMVEADSRTDGGSSQDGIDEFFEDSVNFLLQTSKYNHSSWGAGTVCINTFFQDLINEDMRQNNVVAEQMYGNLAGRLKYGGDGGGASGSGGPAVFPVDFLHSPFVEQLLLDETFDIGAVLQAGFLPAFRPGDLNEGIVAHPDRHATIRVMSIDKEVIYATTNFIMEGYNKATKESFKIIESTLGNTLQLNKEKFKLFKMKLGIIDAEAPFDWLRSWEDKWDKYMRASVLARNRWRWYILFGSHVIGGYPLQFSLGADAKDEPFAGIMVDIFVTDDKPLPEMKRMISKDGLVYFRWGGTTYNPDTLQFESTIREFPTSAPKAMSPNEAEYESET